MLNEDQRVLHDVTCSLEHEEAVASTREKLARVRKRMKNITDVLRCARCSKEWNPADTNDYIDHVIRCDVPLDRDADDLSHECPFCSKFFEVQNIAAFVVHLRACVKQTSEERLNELYKVMMTSRELECIDGILRKEQNIVKNKEMYEAHKSYMKKRYEIYKTYMDEFHDQDELDAGRWARANHERFDMPYITLYKHLDRRLNRKFLLRWIKERKEEGKRA